MCAKRPTSLADALRTETAPFHRKAEQSGIIRDILNGKATLRGYALLLRNLLPAYEALEQGLERHRGTRHVGCFARPPLYRAPAIAHDLTAFAGPGWQRELALLPEGAAYARSIEAAAEADGVRLIGHAYTRYLGDLSGGRVLMACLMRHAGLASDMTAFFAFPGLGDPDAAKAAFRADLDRAGREIQSPHDVLNAAIEAFEFNTKLSEEVRAAVVQPART